LCATLPLIPATSTRVGRRAPPSCYRRAIGWISDLTETSEQRRAGTGDGEQRPVAAEIEAELRHRRLDEPDRACPFVLANLAVAADGRPAIDPQAAGAIEPGAQVEDAARAEVDAVLIGAGTLRSGRYDRPLAAPGLREHRRMRGLARDPLGIVIARSGELPREPALSNGAESPLVIYTAVGDPPITAPAGVEVTRMAPAELTPSAALAHARRERGIRTVLYEGGAGMLGALLASGIADELFLTVDDRLDADPEQQPIHELAGFDRLELADTWSEEDGHSMLLRLRARDPAPLI
jgi:riboflavin biosynthesis pyrimidine reductase